MTLLDSLEDFVAKEGSTLKYRFGDKNIQIDFDATPTISYDYLFIADNSEYSFHNEELNKKSSEEYPNKSDYAIYFEKIKSFCCRTLNESLHNSNHKEHIHTIKPNNKLKKIFTQIFCNKLLKDEDLPPFMQFSLYTNQNDDKAPRIFCAIGNYAVIYILFYDPFHKIYVSK
ncbi:MAG: hypothetical protein LBS69_11155 [Prevotellaceae bacterium]|jgi:hypothetical protein|nr:hypothetical protein [Prevotellaceae bacterium]